MQKKESGAPQGDSQVIKDLTQWFFKHSKPQNLGGPYQSERCAKDVGLAFERIDKAIMSFRIFLHLHLKYAVPDPNRDIEGGEPENFSP